METSDKEVNYSWELVRTETTEYVKINIDDDQKSRFLFKKNDTEEALCAYIKRAYECFCYVGDRHADLDNVHSYILQRKHRKFEEEMWKAKDPIYCTFCRQGLGSFSKDKYDLKFRQDNRNLFNDMYDYIIQQSDNLE